MMINAYSTSRGTRGTVGRIIGAAVTTLAVMSCVTTNAAAQTGYCLERNKLVEALDGRYSEKPIAAGLDVGGRLLEVFASGDGATWTMIMTTPEGTSCVIAAGEKWLTNNKPPHDPEV
jgi:hypothetical protein